MKTLFTFFFAFFLLFVKTASAQYVHADDSYTAQQLVNALVDGSCAQISNISVKGSSEKNSYGYFTNPSSSFPFTNGIVLSTGYATSIVGPNDSLLSEGSTDWPGDLDLQLALDVYNTINATILEFDFVPYTDKISFDYIFASEQYLTSINSPNQCNYTDGFAFLIKEVNSTSPYKNLAVVPGTNIPVRVNTVRGEGVCPPANEEYFGGFSGANHPINFNGQTKVLKAETDVIAGTLYHIKLVVADQGNNLYDSAIFLGGGSFRNTTNLGPDRLFTTNNPVCSGDEVIINATTLNAKSYQWYKDGTKLQNETSALYTVTEQGEYSVSIQLTETCFSTGKIKIEYALLPTSQNYSILQCDENNDGITVFNLDLATQMITNTITGISVQYFTNPDDANQNINPIISTTYQNTVPNQNLYARITNTHGCTSISTLSLLTSANGLTEPSPQTTCDEDGVQDGFTSFNLNKSTIEILQNLPSNLELQYFTSYSDAITSINPITDPENFTNTVAHSQTLYARIYNGSDCFGIVELNLIVYSFREMFDEDIILCKSDTITLDAGNGYSSYSWNTTPIQNTQIINVNEPGAYTVTVTNSRGCKGSKTFTVILSEPATDATIEINDFRGGQNSVTIQPEGLGSYEFSLDGKNYQDSATFNNVTPDKYTVYINDKNGCGSYSEIIYVMDYPKFFTPNNDGVNDTWRIKYLHLFTESEVIIFDRYGKLINSFKGSESGWDGSYNGTPLPSTDYWFIIKLKDGRNVKGHFSMLR